MTTQPAPPAAALPARYAPRWVGMSSAEKLTLAGGDKDLVKELDRLAAGKQVDADPDEALERLRDQLRTITTRLDAVKITTDQLYDHRRRVFLQMLLRGEQVASIATVAQVRPMIINYATGISKKTR